VDARMIMQKNHDRNGHKVATALVFENRKKAIEIRESDAASIRRVNLQLGCNLSVHTIQRSVKKGLIGESPLRLGPVGNFPKPVWEGLTIQTLEENIREKIVNEINASNQN
jgi:hypothetical protein